MTDEVKDILRGLLGEIDRLDYISPGEIPDIPLYMDQITTFMNAKLAGSKRHPDDKILTKTMINNYTKNNLIPPPVKKKYSREHLLLLIFVYYMKDFLSISDIEKLLKPLSERHFGREDGDTIPLSRVYEEIFGMEESEMNYVAKDVVRRYNKAMNTFPDASEEEADYLHSFAFICLLSFDVYAKKQMIIHLLDSMNPDGTMKNPLKKETASSDTPHEKKKAEKAAQKKKAEK